MVSHTTEQASDTDRRTMLKGFGTGVISLAGIRTATGTVEGQTGGPSVSRVRVGHRDPLTGEFDPAREFDNTITSTLDVEITVNGVEGPLQYMVAIVRRNDGGIQTGGKGSLTLEAASGSFVFLGMSTAPWPRTEFEAVATVTDVSQRGSDVGTSPTFVVR